MKKSQARGKRGENKAAELLREWWGDERFMRNFVGSSGAVSTQFAENPHISKQLLALITGDIIPPDDTFPFSVEVKNYEKFDMTKAMEKAGGDRTNLTKWWKQAKSDATRIDKIPLLLIFAQKEIWTVIEKKHADVSFLGKGEPLPLIDGDELEIMAWELFAAYFPKEHFLHD